MTNITITRRSPNASIDVAEFIGDNTAIGADAEHLVRITGLDPTDYLTPAEATALAEALRTVATGEVLRDNTGITPDSENTL
ncbi:hypothetical protein ABQE93_20855 [Mycolicibacterium sp. XJ662]